MTTPHCSTGSSASPGATPGGSLLAETHTRTSGALALGAATLAWLLAAVALYAVVYRGRDDDSEDTPEPP